ncbi:MAG: beta-lactamase [Sulfuricurvum sp. PC08-66]|nr:MAG: beta-lactamase [Sulfuricurvum sp. PC08-66]
MTVQSHPMGPYQTNCYIATVDGKDFIIDPGVDALEWIVAHTQNPVAILNTHGHFDHVWSNAAVQAHFNIPIYCPKADIFFLSHDPFGQGTPPSHCDYPIEGDHTVLIAGIEVEFLHFAGHTPGCSMIRIGDVMFSGDFIFQNSIGRYDFPYSDADAMRQSLKRFMTLPYDMPLYAGHGRPTSIAAEQPNIPYWLERF